MNIKNLLHPIFKISFLVVILTFTSCKKQTTFNEVTVNDKYTILIPDYVKPSAGMHQQASLQYQNQEKEFYVLVIDESQSDMKAYDLNYDIETYFQNIVSLPFKENIKNGVVSTPQKREINGANALVAEITGSVNNTDVFYKMAVIESPNKFYQVLTWTRADQKKEYEEDMLKIIESLKEL